jgi:TetR/AcrR family transcriptional regulator
MNASTKRNSRRASEELRERLISASLVEFAANGYEGASTRAIAARAGAHQPQINYHFESKEALWEAAVRRLMEQLDAAMELPAGASPRDQFAHLVRSLTKFASAHPELQRIMIQEGTDDTGRLRWIVETFVRPRHEALIELWRRLVASGDARPVSDDLIQYILVGAGSLLYANAPEARILSGIEPTDPELVERHAQTLIDLFLTSQDDLQTNSKRNA